MSPVLIFLLFAALTFFLLFLFVEVLKFAGTLGWKEPRHVLRVWFFSLFQEVMPRKFFDVIIFEIV